MKDGEAMGKNRTKPTGEESFDIFYRAIYKDRWETLRSSMTENKDTVLLSERLSSPYYMDQASVIVASLLPVEDGDRILDMCAAPGGKTLSIALRLGENGRLVSNDRSQARVLRLKKVLDECLDSETREKVDVRCHDASSWCLHEQDAYDKVLLDAPCSSERHVINDRKYLDMWSPSRPKRLAKEQYALLSSGFIALKKGGILLYSTCSINPGENEEIIGRLLKKRHDEAEEIAMDLEIGERREHGMLILPDSEGGLGPMYCCLVRKK